MVAVFFRTFLLVNSVSGVNGLLNERVSSFAFRSTPSLLAVGRLFSSKSIVDIRSSGMSLRLSP